MGDFVHLPSVRTSVYEHVTRGAKAFVKSFGQLLRIGAPFIAADSLVSGLTFHLGSDVLLWDAYGSWLRLAGLLVQVSYLYLIYAMGRYIRDCHADDPPAPLHEYWRPVASVKGAVGLHALMILTVLAVSLAASAMGYWLLPLVLAAPFAVVWFNMAWTIYLIHPDTGLTAAMEEAGTLLKMSFRRTTGLGCLTMLICGLVSFPLMLLETGMTMVMAVSPSTVQIYGLALPFGLLTGLQNGLGYLAGTGIWFFVMHRYYRDLTVPDGEEPLVVPDFQPDAQQRSA